MSPEENDLTSVFGGRAFQAQGTAGAKVLRQEHVLGTSRRPRWLVQSESGREQMGGEVRKVSQ